MFFFLDVSFYDLTCDLFELFNRGVFRELEGNVDELSDSFALNVL